MTYKQFDSATIQVDILNISKYSWFNQTFLILLDVFNTTRIFGLGSTTC